MNKICLILFIILTFSVPGFAAEVLVEFATPHQEQLYQDLTQQLRCLVCQNETLADSQSALAQDLRKQIREKIQQGNDKKTIISFLTQRYCDFILYSPPWQKNTYLLWLFPFLLLVLGIVILLLVVKRR